MYLFLLEIAAVQYRSFTEHYKARIRKAWTLPAVVLWTMFMKSLEDRLFFATHIFTSKARREQTDVARETDLPSHLPEAHGQ